MRRKFFSAFKRWAPADHSSLAMLDTLIVPASGPHRSSLIWLHGLGADCEDFAFLPEFLSLPSSLGLRYVFPNAPKRPISLNGGMVMRAWYDIAAGDLDREGDLAGIDSSLTEVESLIEAERALGIPPQNILVGGFSQGSVLAIETLTQLGTKVGGAIALSGYLPRDEEKIPAAQPDQGTLFMAHGLEDSLIRPELGIRARDALRRKGYEIHWSVWPIGHSVSEAELGALRDWLVDRLSREPQRSAVVP